MIIADLMLGGSWSLFFATDDNAGNVISVEYRRTRDSW